MLGQQVKVGLGVRVALALVIALLVPRIALASHGSFTYSQESYDWSSTFKVRPKSKCSAGCDEVRAEIYQSGYWTTVTCTSSNEACFSVYGAWKYFSFPSWVYTHHYYCDVYGGALPCHHHGSFNKSVWYP